MPRTRDLAGERAPPLLRSEGAFLRDGTEVWVRPILLSDRDMVHELLASETVDTLESRFFGAVRPEVAEEEIARPCGEDRLCLLVLGERAGHPAILGVGEYVTTPGAAATVEVDFLVATPFRRRGIATLLLHRLGRAAAESGITRCTARVRPENLEMLGVFRRSGWPERERTEAGEVLVDMALPTAPGPPRASRGPPAVTAGG